MPLMVLLMSRIISLHRRTGVGRAGRNLQPCLTAFRQTTGDEYSLKALIDGFP